MNKKHIYKHEFNNDKNSRSKKYNQNPITIWITGLSGSGKSTISNALENLLFEKGYLVYSLDGDNIRSGLSSDLEFSTQDRNENIRRIAEVSKLFMDSGLIVLASFISPLRNQRDLVKQIVGKANYFEVFLSTSLEVCEKRDVKGLYKKARNGEIENFTGISSKYETPKSPNIKIDTSNLSIEDSVQLIYDTIQNKLNV